ncbi:MAG: Asp/Glu racemase [Waddliaceae bacterium]
MTMNVSEIGTTVNIENIPFETDLGIGARAKIGILVLATDHTMEYEFRKVINIPGVAFYHSRIPNSPNITPETLSEMENDLANRAAIILPGVDLDVVAYGCTSASMVLGEETVFARIREGRPEAKPTTPITAAFAAFDAFKARRIAVLTPYTREVNNQVRAYITSRGFEIPVFGSFDKGDDNVVARISSDSIRQAILQVGKRDDVDMVFLSCTNLRFAEIVNEVESELGKPVTSSNHAMAWHCLRLAGIDDRLPQFGQLYNL